VEDPKIQEERVEGFYWQKLAELHSGDVCARAEAVYHPGTEGYVLHVYNRRYMIIPKNQTILRVDPNDRTVEESLTHFFKLMVLLYLIGAREKKPSHDWVSEKDLKGGEIFFRGPHSLEVGPLEECFGRDPEGIVRAGARLGGSEILYGDRGVAIDVFPKVPLAYVLWKGDEEFPAKVGVMFDSTIQEHFSLDAIWFMVAETTRRLTEAGC
jgi:hypothetical protein